MKPSRFQFPGSEPFPLYVEVNGAQQTFVLPVSLEPTNELSATITGFGQNDVDIKSVDV